MTAGTVEDSANAGDGSATTTTSVVASGPPLPNGVVVHPLVLLSVVDHYNRLARDTNKRVVGVLLGEVSQGKVDITNSFAVPFDEDVKDPSIWFLDHNFLESMFAMFRKVSAKEKIMGWYSTGPKIRPADLAIHELFRKYTPNPVFVIIEATPRELGIPTEAYISVEEVSEDGRENARAFVHVPSEIGALEAEEIGVEHLLRDIKDATVSTLTTQVHEKVQALKGLMNHLDEMKTYLENVLSGRLPRNHQIMYQLQDILNLLPKLQVQELVKSFTVNNNDTLLVVYLSSLIRSVIALHNLINNKIKNRDDEKSAAAAAATATNASADKKGDSGASDAKSQQDNSDATSSSKPSSDTNSGGSGAKNNPN